MSGKIFWIMRKVGVHLDHDVEALLERPAETSDIRRSEAHFLRTMKNMDLGIFFGESLDKSTRPVGRSVIDDQKLGILERRAVQRLKDLLSQLTDVFNFVVSRDDDQRFHGGPVAVR